MFDLRALLRITQVQHTMGLRSVLGHKTTPPLQTVLLHKHAQDHARDCLAVCMLLLQSQ
jgi:hypothetical protein